MLLQYMSTLIFSAINKEEGHVNNQKYLNLYFKCSHSCIYVDRGNMDIWTEYIFDFICA